MSERQRCVCVCIGGKGVVSLSQAVVVDRTVYVSGQLGLDVSSGQLVDGGVQAQAKQVREEDAGGDVMVITVIGMII